MLDTGVNWRLDLASQVRERLIKPLSMNHVFVWKTREGRRAKPRHSRRPFCVQVPGYRGYEELYELTILMLLLILILGLSTASIDLRGRNNTVNVLHGQSKRTISGMFASFFNSSCITTSASTLQPLSHRVVCLPKIRVKILRAISDVSGSGTHSPIDPYEPRTP